MPVESEQFLHADREHRLVLFIADWHRTARWRGKVGRRKLVDPPLNLMRHQRHQAIRYRLLVDAGEGRLACKEREKPFLQPFDKRFVAQVRPGMADAAMQPGKPAAQ